MQQWTWQQLILLTLIPGIGIKTQNKILNHCDNFVALSQFKNKALHNWLTTQTLKDHSYQRLELIIEQQKTLNFSIIPINNEHYPSQLKTINDPPLILYCLGQYQLLKQRQIALVGSRKASEYALTQTKTFAQALGHHEFTITSGLAMGIDTAAHEGAIENNSQTIAVLGTGIDTIYPKRNKHLAADILQKNNLIISEYAPGTPGEAWRFPARNRIISGLSKAVIIMEASEKSGSLITARLAMEQGRDVFAMPGHINNPNTLGSHQLIRQGATIAFSVAEILEEMGFDQSTQDEISIKNNKIDAKIPKNTPNADQTMLLRHIDFEATPFDLILERSRLTHMELSTQLLELELQSLILRGPGGYSKA
jgi:DNA processing protein